MIMFFEKEIDYNIKTQNPELFLLKPNKVTVGKLKEAYDIKLKTKLGNINELSFKIPFFYEFNHNIIEDPHIQLLKERYLIKLLLNSKEEYFILDSYSRNMEDEEDYMEINCYSLSMELRDTYIKNYDATGFTLDEIFNGKTNYPPELYGDGYIPTTIQKKGLLYKTNWKVTSIDAYYSNIKRSYKLNNSSTTILNSVFSIAELYKATIVFNTTDRTIQIKTPESQISNRGLTFSYGHYLKSLNQEVKTENMVTRLYVYGENDLGIESVNGSGYIEDYSYFLYPFERDSNRNVIKHSDYMSDELCHALLDYKKLIEDNIDNVKNLNRELSTLNDELFTLQYGSGGLQEKEVVLINAQNAHYIKWNSGRDDGTTSGKPYTEKKYQSFVDDTIEWQMVVVARNKYFTQLALVNTKQSEINAKQSEINALMNILSEDNNFTTELLEEKKKFTIEKEFNDTNQTDPQTLYEKGLEEFQALMLPEKSISIDIDNFLECVEEQWNWHKLYLGAEVIVRNERIGVNVISRIIEIEYDFENGDINLVISTKDDLTDDATKIAKLLNQLASTSIQVERTRPLIEELNKKGGKVENILNQFWDDVRNQVKLAVNQSVVIDDMGITIYELDENGDKTEKFLRITNGCLAISDDNGTSYKHAITSNGIIGERIYGRIITGEQLTLGDADGFLEIHGNKGTITDRFEREVMAFGLYNYDHDTEIPNPANDKFGIRLFGKYPTTDKNEQPRTKVVMDSEDGFYIEKRENFNGTYQWVKKYYVDSDGNLFAHDMTTYGLKILNKPDGVTLLDADTRFMDIGRISNIVVDDSLTPLEKIQVKSEWTRIESEFLELQRAYEEHRYSFRDSIAEGIRGNRDHLNDSTSPVWNDYPVKIAFWNTYLNAKNALNQYLNVDVVTIPTDKQGSLLSSIRKDITERADGISGDELSFGTGFERDVFIQKFQDYYESAKNLVDAINTLIRWSATELGKNYNEVIMDAENGVTVYRKNTSDIRDVMTKLNATEGISISTLLNNVWFKRFFVDLNGIINARGLRIADNLDQTLINAEINEMNIGKFDKIYTEGKLTSLQKERLQAEWIRIQAEYVKLVTYAETYRNIDRDSVDHINTTVTAYTNAYNVLARYVPPLLSNMDETTEIDSNIFDANFENYYTLATELLNKINEILRYSSLQLGQNYNDTIIDSQDGITVYRNDGLGNQDVRTRLNATEGISISRKESGSWTPKFYVDINGVLNAIDLVADRLILRDANGDVIIDANSGFLNLNKFDKIVGNLQAENITTKILTADEGYIADLAVNKLVTLDADSEQNPEINYIDIQKQWAKWITGTSSGNQVQKTNKNGDLLYWTDSDRTSTTIDDTGLPVMVNEYNKLNKMEMGFDFDPSTNTAIPIIKMGTGTGLRDNDKGILKKENDLFQIKYINDTGIEKGISFNATDIVLTNDNPTGRILYKCGESEMILARRRIFTGNFAGISGKTIQHDLGTYGIVDYCVSITPTMNTGGNLGEFWVEKSTNSIKVCNTGTSTAKFDCTITY